MKRFKKAAAFVFILWMAAGLIYAGSAPPAEEGYSGAGTPAVADTTTTLTGFGKQLTLFGRSRRNIGFALTVSGRSANDSLLVTVQTSNTLADTNTWVNLTAFGGVKVANGTTVRAYSRDATNSDSTFFLGRYVRVMVNHGATAGSSLAGDSSRVNLQITEWGN